MKVCFVSTQFPDLTDAGGISYPLLRLARRLVENGHVVTVILSRTQKPLTGAILRKYKRQGIDLVAIHENREMVSPWWLAFQYSISDYLFSKDFDVVISQEWQAPLALYSGLSHLSVPTITWIHGGTYYDQLAGSAENIDSLDSVLSYLENLQIRKSDHVVAPSNFILNFYRSLGASNDKSTLIPLEFPERKTSVKSAVPVLAFVGAISIRKGFEVFLDKALSLLALDPNLRIRIYGQFTLPELEAKLKEKLEKYDYQVHSDQNSEQIWDELVQYNTTLMVPSLLDNSPGVIYEALSSGAKVLVSNSQGGGELSSIFPKQVRLLEEMDSRQTYEFMMSTIVDDVDIESINERHFELWESIINQAVVSRKKLKSASELGNTVTVIIPTKNRPDMLRKALNSVLAQTKLPLEVIVIDDASDDEKSVPAVLDSLNYSIPIHLIRNSSSVGPGASRNMGVERAAGSLVAFLDDDNLFAANHLELCISFFECAQIDAVTPYLAQTLKDDISTKSSPDQIAIFAGSHFGVLNRIVNLVCDSHIVIKRSVFQQVDGFDAFRGASQEDWGLGLKLISRGYNFVSTTEPSIIYRLNEDGVQFNGRGVKHWWPVHTADQFSDLDSWVIGELARKGLQQTPIRSNRKKYFKFAVSLLRKGDFLTLIRGVVRYVKNYLRRRTQQ